MAVESFRELLVWQKAMDLATECYRLTRAFPQDERFGLTSQIRRAAASVPANIAEGQGRGSTPAYVNHLWIANGSLREVETHLELAGRLGYVADSEVSSLFALASEIGRMLIGLRRSLGSR